MSNGELKQINRMVQKSFYCPFCKRDFKKLIHFAQYENLDSVIGPTTRRNGLIPMQCDPCVEKEQQSNPGGKQ
jgi:hypothetical protein